MEREQAETAMSSHTPERRVKAFLEVVAVNNLNYNDVSQICNTPQSTVFKWLNGTLVPSDSAVLLLHSAIFCARLTMPREFNRVHGSIKTGCVNWVRENKRKGCVEYVGEKLRDDDFLTKQFIYKRKKMSLPKICEAAGVPYHAIYQRLLKAGRYVNGEDITDIVKKPINKRKKKGE